MGQTFALHKESGKKNSAGENINEHAFIVQKKHIFYNIYIFFSL